MRTKIWLIALINLLLLAACSATSVGALSPAPDAATFLPRPTQMATVPSVPTFIDPGLTYGQPCKAPCWHGFIPGKTTLAEILQTLPRLHASETPYEFPEEEGLFPGNIPPRDRSAGAGGVSLLMDWDKNILQAIHGLGFHFEYSLGQMVTQFGEPEIVYDFESHPSHKSCADWTPSDKPETAYLTVFVLYPTQGLLFTVGMPASGTSLLCPEMKVTSFCYYTPLTVKEALTDHRLTNWCEYELLKGMTDQNVLQW